MLKGKGNLEEIMEEMREENVCGKLYYGEKMQGVLRTRNLLHTSHSEEIELLLC